MDPRTATEHAQMPIGPDTGDPDAIEFVRFCYRRRRVGWPELYDEMCAVVGRGLYRGYDAADLNRMGIGLTLFEMPALAALVHRVVAEDHERRRRSVQAVRAAYVAAESEAALAEAADAGPAPTEPAAVAATDDGAAGQPPNPSFETASDKRPSLATVPIGA